MKAAVLFITIFAVAGINSQAESAAVTTTPEPCCFPPQFSTDIMQMKSPNKPGVTYYRSNYDYTQKREAVVSYNYSPETKEKTQVVQVLLFYTQEKMYIVTGEHKENCREMPLNQPMYPNCLEGMTFVGSSYLGPPSAQLAVNTWTTRNDQFNVTISVTANECILVAQTQVGEINGLPTDDVMLYENFEPGKLDHGAFDVPPSCTNATQPIA